MLVNFMYVYNTSKLQLYCKLNDFRYLLIRMYFTIREKNSVDSDHMASMRLADLDLHCFKNMIYIWAQHGKA